MKRFLALLLALLCLLPVLSACGGDEAEKTIVGVWKSEELSTSSFSQKLVYAFAPNGHMLSIDLYEDQITSVIGAHYDLDEKGILSIRQFGKEDGEMIATLSGDTLTLALNLESGTTEDGEDLSNKSITFTREKDPKEAVIIGHWLYAYIDENGKTLQIQYAFTEDGNAARALYEGNDLTDGMLTDYVAQKYTFQTVNGEELLYIFTENADGTQAELEVFRVGFPYDGYMTMEPLVDTEGATEVLPFRAISEEKK